MSTYRPRLPGLIRRRGLAFLLAVVALLCVGPFYSTAHAIDYRRPANPAVQRPVLVENRTFTPLWYRLSNGGRYGQWVALLPGQRHSYSQQQLTIEVSLYGGNRKFRLTPGNTYYHGRTSPAEAGQFFHDAADRAAGRWHVPKPPQREEFQRIARVSWSGRNPSFQPLEQFIDRCEADGQEYKLSLKELAVACYLAQEQGGTIPSELRYLRDFTWFFGYLIDRESQDVILLGVKDPTRPPIDLDCLCTAIKAVHEGETPACSLDDHEDPRYQKSVIRGVPWNTKWAKIMIDADYDMKKLGQGHLDPRISTFRSDWDYSYWEARQSNRRGVTKSVNRWWFNFNGSQSRSVVSRSGELAVLYHNPVRVSSELMVAGEFGTGATSGPAERFASDFTRHLDTLGKHYPSVAELQALYRLYDIFRHLSEMGKTVPPAIAYWTTLYQRPYAGPPSGMPTLSRQGNYRWRDGGSIWTLKRSVTGGVSMHLPIPSESAIRQEPPQELLSRISGPSSPPAMPGS